MNIIISKNPVEDKRLKPFTPCYDRVYVSVDNEQFEDYKGFGLSEKNIKKLFDSINHSWDGDIYWFKDKDAVLAVLDTWFQNEDNHPDTDDLGIGNCFLIKYTPHGVCLIDTQLDMSSNIDSFLAELNKQHPGITYEYYSDSHLIDNIKLGRNSINNEFETMYLLYKEGVIDNSFFLSGIEHFSLDDSSSEYYQVLPHDREIVITGKLCVERDYVLDTLEMAGYKYSEKITSNSWLWYGDKVGAKKMEAAKNIPCNSIDEVVDMAYQNYLGNKKRLHKSLKM